MHSTTRRMFLGSLGTAGGAAALGVAGPSDSRAASGSSSEPPFSLGMASYTFRNFDRDDAVAMTVRLGLTHIAFKDFHLAYDTPLGEIETIAAGVRAAGLDLYGCGVVYMTTEAEVNRAFDYAAAAGMRTIIGVPDHGLLPLVNRKVGEYGIAVAIHNHGPGDELYPSPESVHERIRDLDPRIGLCIDIGHAARLGLDPSVEAERFASRLLDIHIKDVSAATAEGGTVEIGRGVIDIPRFLRTLVKLDYRGVAALEYEKDPDDPLPGAAESIGYVRGVLAAL